MKKRVTSLFLALLMAVTLLPVQVLADELAAPDTAMDTHQAAEVQEPVEAETEADAPVSQESVQDTAPLSTGAVYTGTLGENVNWSLDTGTGALAVTGSGAMDDYSQGTSPLWSCRSYIKSVTIADTVTSVGNYVFINCSNLTTVRLGSGITSIGDRAFESCSALTAITIPDSVTSIGANAFYNCAALDKVTIPDLAAWLSISFQGAYANPVTAARNLYVGDELLTELVIPDTVTEINPYAFYGCASINSVYLPRSVTSIG